MKLYRGEKIRNGNDNRLTLLKKSLVTGLPADFVNGGDPYFLQKTGLLDTTINHVANDSVFPTGYKPKHLISFSEKKEVAEKYAGGADQDSGTYVDYSSAFASGTFKHEVWDNSSHLLFEVDISSRKDVDGHGYGFIIESTAGKIFAINASVFFHIQESRLGKYAPKTDIYNAKKNAECDFEWLLMSADLIPAQSGQRPSASGIIKNSEILTTTFFLDADYYLASLQS